MSSPSHASEALFYARRGWSVFPLAPRSKQPMAGTRGYLDAAVNETQVRDWWTSHPDANIGIAPDGADLWILDVDPRHGGNESLDQLEAEHGKLPETPLVLTGGCGRHYYLRAPERVAVPRRIGVRPRQHSFKTLRRAKRMKFGRPGCLRAAGTLHGASAA